MDNLERDIAEYLTTGIIRCQVSGQYYFSPAEIILALGGTVGAAGLVNTLMQRALDAEDAALKSRERTVPGGGAVREKQG